MISSSSSSRLDSETAMTSRYTGGGGRGWSRRPGPANNPRSHHRRGSPSRSQWSSYPSTGPSLGRRFNGAEGSRIRESEAFLGDQSSTHFRDASLNGDVGDRESADARSQWLQSMGDYTSCRRQQPSGFTPTVGAERKCHPADAGGAPGIDEPPAPAPVHVSNGRQHSTPSGANGGEWHRDSDTLQGSHHPTGMLSRPLLQERQPSAIDGPLPSISSDHDVRCWQSNLPAHSAVEAAAGMASPNRPLLFWDLGSGQRGGVGTIPSQQGAGLASPAVGGSRRQCEGGGRSGDMGDHEESNFDRFCRDDRLLRGSTLPGPPRHHSPQPQDRQPPQQHPRSQLLMFPPADGIIPGNPPSLCRGVSDPGLYSAAVRALLSGEAHSTHPCSPWSDLVEADAKLGDQAPRGSRSAACAFHELHGGSGGCGGGGGVPTEWWQGERRRRWEEAALRLFVLYRSIFLHPVVPFLVVKRMHHRTDLFLRPLPLHRTPHTDFGV